MYRKGKYIHFNIFYTHASATIDTFAFAYAAVGLGLVQSKMAGSEDIDRVTCVKNEVFVYKIPPRQSNRGYRYY